jgi:uncharacterized protein (DUF885 family)
MCYNCSMTLQKLFKKETKTENSDVEEAVLLAFQAINLLAEQLEELAKIVVANGQTQNSLIGTVSKQNEILAKNQQQIINLQQQINHLATFVLPQIVKNRNITS